VRPTADRVRESLFARIADLSGARVLDAFAGTGALGIEALSRGAASAVFVERSAPVLAVLRENLERLGIAEAARVVRGEARAALRRLAAAGERFDWIFLDPPYGTGLLPELLEVAAGLLADHGQIVLEASRWDPLPLPAGLAILDARPYGDTVITRLVAADRPHERPEEGSGNEPE
jgi:16S rRNA (guanine(966)-N(2))-methyltransferase RsmD